MIKVFRMITLTFHAYKKNFTCFATLINCNNVSPLDAKVLLSIMVPNEKARLR